MNSLKKKRVLIVEDDEILREVLQEEFINADAQVIAVNGGNQALVKLKETLETKDYFDLIVTDIQMADGGGPVILDKLNEFNFKKKPMVLMISGHTDLPTEELLKKGADFVFTKPFELEDLIKKACLLLKREFDDKY